MSAHPPNPGVSGLDRDATVILAFLVTEDPLLLIGVVSRILGHESPSFAHFAAGYFRRIVASCEICVDEP